jgi:hypothetical protein
MADGNGLYDFYRLQRRRFLKQCASHREITRRFKPGAEALKWVQRDMAAFRSGWFATRAGAL